MAGFGHSMEFSVLIHLTDPISFLLGENVEILPAEYLLTANIHLKIHNIVF